MLTGFCFGAKGSSLDILKVKEDDFCILLMDYCKERNITDIAMDVDTRFAIKYGVMDMMHNGFNVIIVDPSYSPIADDRVLPLNIHRNLATLGNYYPSVVCIGRLLIQMILSNKVAFTEFVSVEEEGEVLNSVPLKDMGWSGISKDKGALVYNVYSK